MATVWKEQLDGLDSRLLPEELEYAVAMYDGGIRHVDERFGELVEFLKAHGLYDRSIVVVISDHGDEFQEHDSLFHTRIYGTVTRIPLIMRFPETRYAGSYAEVSESIDLMPTLLGSVRAPVPATAQGRSLLPLLKGKSWGGKLAITESPHHGRRLAAASEGQRLLMTKHTGATELYAYRSDPLEQTDVSARHPEQSRRLQEALVDWERRVAQTSWGVKEVESMEDRVRAQLQALGYIDSGGIEISAIGFEGGDAGAWSRVAAE
jgi:arylsulfatase A-like enzyme